MLGPTIDEDQTANSKGVDEQLAKTDDEKEEIVQQYQHTIQNDFIRGEQISGAVGSFDHNIESCKSESENTISSQDRTSNTPVHSMHIVTTNWIGH